MTALNLVIGAAALAPALWWGGADDGGGGWWLARLLFGLIWIVLVALAIRWIVFGRRRWAPSGVERARGILAERYARGEIDRLEYEERRAALTAGGANWP